MSELIHADESHRLSRSTGPSDPFGSPGGFGRQALDMRYMLAVARRNLLVIGIILAVALSLTVIATLLMTPQYTAGAKIQINDSTGRIMADEEGTQDESQGAGWDTDRFLKTQTEVIASRGLALRVAQRLNLAGNPAFFAAQQSPAPAPGTPLAQAQLDAAALLRGNLNVVLPRDSRIVTIEFSSTDPKLAAKIANAYVDEFIQSNLQRKFDSSSYARSFLGEQLQTAKQKVEESERALNTYARSAGLIIPRNTSGTGKDGSSSDSSGSVTTSSLLQLNSAANDATAKRIVAEGRWRAISSAPLLTSNEVLSNGTITTLLGQKAQIEASLKEEQSRHKDDYPAVLGKRSQLKSINDQIQATANNIKNSVRSDFEAATDAENRLLDQVRNLKNDTLAEQDRTVQYGLLSRDADTNRQVYEGLLERYKKLNAVAGVSLSNISVIDDAEAPGVPSSPKLFRNLLIGLLAGGAAAAMVVFLREQFNDSIRVPEDVENKLEMALLGVIPGARDDDPDAALADPKSAVTEAYNSLRGSLMYSTSEGLPKVIQVTSAQPAEGKTTTSLAIATGLARMGRTVLLIDADLRRPSVHRRVEIANDAGLSTLLTSHANLADIAVQTAQPNLSVLPSGPVPPSPTELLSSNRLEELLQEAARLFDTVIVDSPPVLGLADAPLMSALADGVIFVVEANRNRRGSLRGAIRRLRAMRPIILGAVLTKFEASKAGNQYYSDYYGYDYYQYGESSKKDAE
ncbi:polysaccharide biosynthesis tyrosine autokinase [Novosphingobium sp. KCTC 2891]|uniref:GumC family protein n=1 Tax=Novosphingobium sp. KCTC 2891 TaxID=2989730 RepID=UPI002221A005|nr:polysaccharide biosynthesis tyrosine autokinase [Novosphingobium sp. KCTC 2891]MCW1383256.1 polysaccharide biosynthesis tyrosine autokinase [Novosphingobium sp. KCTC 2891]